MSLTAVTTADEPRQAECKACHDQCMIFSYNLQDFEDFIDFATVTFCQPPPPAYKRFCPKLIIGLKCVTDHCWLLCCCGQCIKIEPWPRPVGP